MKFNVEMNIERAILIKLNEESCLMWITFEGLDLNATGFPQNGVDYAQHNILKITGVDDLI